MIFRFVLIALTLLMAGCANRSTAPLRTAGKVDIERYAGKWYEIARLPNGFQRDDSRATAEYGVNPTGTVEVLNTEYRPDGSTKYANGEATVVPGSGASRLRVKFDGLAGLIPLPDEGNYWIIALAPDYSVALVGTPDRKFLWLLARQPQIPVSKRQQFVEIAKREGFDTAKLLLAKWPR